MVFGLILVAVGIIALLVKAGVLTGSVWDYVWPAALIILGLSFFLGRGWWHRRWRWHDWRPRDRDDRDNPRQE